MKSLKRRTSEILALPRDLSRRFSSSWLSSDVQLVDVSKSSHLISTQYESLDYDVAENELYTKEANQQDSDLYFRMRVSLARWFVMFLIGVFTALIAFGIDAGQFVSVLMDVHFIFFADTIGALLF